MNLYKKTSGKKNNAIGHVCVVDAWCYGVVLKAMIEENCKEFMET